MHDNSKLLASLNCINITTGIYKWASIHVKFTLAMPWRHTGGEEVQVHPFLTSSLDRGVWFTSRFTMKEAQCPLNRGMGWSQSLP